MKVFNELSLASWSVGDVSGREDEDDVSMCKDFNYCISGACVCVHLCVHACVCVSVRKLCLLYKMFSDRNFRDILT